MSTGLIITLIISIVILLIWGFLMYVIITNAVKKDATKLIQMHILTFVTFFLVYTFTTIMDDIYNLGLWKYQEEIGANMFSKMSQGSYHCVIQHTTFGTSTINSRHWLTRMFDIIHYSTSFFLNSSLFFEMLEETEEQGFNLFRAVGLKIGQIKNNMTKTNTRNFTPSKSMSLKSRGNTANFSRTPTISLNSPPSLKK